MSIQFVRALMITTPTSPLIAGRVLQCCQNNTNLSVTYLVLRLQMLLFKLFHRLLAQAH
jgi:hypothetical protein